MNKKKGRFTLPGESGYEKLTLELAEKWGADIIRDSDGTQLSEEILNSGYGIYSTVCVIREHNEWVEKNQETQQQTFLMAGPVLAKGDTVKIFLMEEFWNEQFQINDSKEAMEYWQVFDRTSNREIDRECWSYDRERECLILTGIQPYHAYTVNFLAYRIWEEISMYNHVTNNWEKEHLRQIDPCYPKAREYLIQWMEKWCMTHPSTTVVRFTSLFYNFVWIWGSDMRKRNYYTDWGSYDFTVSPYMLNQFKKKYGCNLTSEDFINQGRFHVTHMPSTEKQRAWMEFVNEFVTTFAGKLVDIVHKHHKEAYLFYDDSWIGTEPYGEHFREMGFDGVIKCVFSGYEARMCAGVKVNTHEIRLHPYLFPVGLGGAPTFAEGGNPAKEAKEYWVHVRRALMREPVERIGLGGYLHLVEKFPNFVDYMEQLSDEFREIAECSSHGKAETAGVKVGVLHDWGNLRPWTLSGHFHETYMHDLIHVNEALSGLPVDVSFLSFEDIKNGKLDNIDVIINAGKAGSAWSGGIRWKEEKIVSKLNEWVCSGGMFIGVNEPSAVSGYHTFFRMAEVLGIDEDTGAKICHGRWQFETTENSGILPEGYEIAPKENLYLTDKNTEVLAEKEGQPVLTVHDCGKGKGIYLSSFEFTWENTRMLMNLLLIVQGETSHQGKNSTYRKYITDNYLTECAYYRKAGKLIVVNNSAEEQVTEINTEAGIKTFILKPFELRTENLIY